MSSIFLQEVKSLAAFPVRVGVNICAQPPPPVSNYPTKQGIRSVSASNIISIIRADTRRVGAARLGFFPEDVGTHSLRSDGAMAMHIVGVLDWTLMAICQWPLLVFMVYIQQYISSFSVGVLVHMSEQPWFRHL